MTPEADMIVQARKEYTVVTEKNVPMKTRDGITLFADVVRPDMVGRFPVLLSRTPYGKRGMDDPNGPHGCRGPMDASARQVSLILD